MPCKDEMVSLNISFKFKDKSYIISANGMTSVGRKLSRE